MCIRDRDVVLRPMTSACRGACWPTDRSIQSNTNNSCACPHQLCAPKPGTRRVPRAPRQGNRPQTA
eukprot:11793231-Alexandrium_andersonii.AAC.1